MRRPAAVLAVDVALLLPQPAEARVRRASDRLRFAGRRAFTFDPSHHPHVTLLQQAMRRDALATAGAALAGFAPIPLRVTGVGSGATTSHLLLAPDPDLQRLHLRVADALAPLAEAEVTAEAFHAAGDEPPRARDLAWVRDFRATAAYEQFWPHITLGVGEPPETVVPFGFTARRVALCQLGRFCTCRVILEQWELESGPLTARSGRRRRAR